MKKKIKPKKIGYDYYHISYHNHILTPCTSSIIKHDNSKAHVMGSGARGLYIRIPSIKRSDKVWKNFYKLFPSVYFKVQEIAKKNGITSGIITIPWESRVNFNHQESRTVKAKVIDLNGQFTKVSNSLSNKYPFMINEKVLINEKNKIYISKI